MLHIHLPLFVFTIACLPQVISSNVEPSQKIGPYLSTFVDAIYVIGLKQCSSRWRFVTEWANEHDLQLTPIHATPYSDIDLYDPPIPIVGVPANVTVTSGQVACTHSHIRVWRDAFVRNHSRIIVLEDDVRLSSSLLHRLDAVFFDADFGTAKRQAAWHYLYLRMRALNPHQPHTPWHGHVNRANPGWGTAAYALSAAGVRYLLTRVTAYSYPLDVQIERLQRGLDTQGASFIALHACRLRRDGLFPQGCLEDVYELSLTERVGCFESATAVGATALGAYLPAPGL